MRSKKALINSIFGMSYEVISLICGLIVPRLIIGSFGSAYNGVTSSITQFLNCVILFKTCVTGVTKAALYKPLSEHNDYEISAILKSTEAFMRKIAIIFAISLGAFACIYPIFVREEFSWAFSASLVLILGISTFVQYYFGVTYQILLTADQKMSVVYFAQIVSVILNTIFATVLIKLGMSIHMVKLGSAIAFSVNPLIINIYAFRHYKINRNAVKNDSAIKQKWDAFGQAAAAFVHNNTDLVVLTIFSTVYDVSVYTVYAMVCNGLKTLLKTFTSSIGAAFGNMMAKDETIVMKKNMDIFEYVTITLTTLFFTVAGIMMLPFVSVYTKGVNDAEYLRPWFSLIMVVGMAFFCYRIPYQTVIEAAGHFKQTRNGALLEAFANIVISVITVIKFGLIGVAIGTLIANLIRTINYVSYLSNNIMNRSYWYFLKQMGTSAIIVGVTVSLSRFLGITNAENYYQFAFHAIICGIICLIITVLVSLLFYRNTMFSFINMFLRSIRERQNRTLT